MKKPVVLRIYKGEQLSGVKQFTEDQIVIGSQPEVQVSLNDDKVSPIHAAIEDRDGSYYICDLGSESGTLLNDENVLDSKIESSDLIRIGDFRIEFYIGVPKPKTAPVVPDRPAPGGARVSPPPPPKDAVEAPPPPSAPASAPAMAGGGMQVPIDPYKIQSPPTFPSDSESRGSLTPPAANRAPSARSGSANLPFAKAKVAKAHKKKVGGTFAPQSKYQSFREFVKPSKGTVVEVLVLWRERVINATHFSGQRTITMGSLPDCDIVLPVVISRQRKVPILKIDTRAIVLISSDLTGELIKGQQSQSFIELMRQNRMQKDASGYALVLDQGEMIRLELTDQISIIIRYTSDSPKPLIAPMLDLTAAEFTGVVMAFVMVGILWLYNFLYTPHLGLPGDEADEPMRTAVIEMERVKPPPVPIPPPVKEEPKPTPPPTPPPVVKSTPSPTKVEPKPQQTKAQNPEPKQAPGAASNVAPNQNDKKAPRTQTSIKQGGAVKTGATEGAQAKSQRKDVARSGVFSVFGGGGRQDRQDTSYSGAGELSGFADAATGRAGQNTNRPGEGLGTPFKDTGAGGTGTAAVGVAGVNTKGRGGGTTGYGTGGLGQRKGVQIVPGGNEESFSGTIDREAIRRAVLANIRAIKSCYERELNRNPDLFGKLVMEWVIGEQGRVVQARVKSSEVKGQVGNCVRDIIRSIKFPEPPTNEEVTVAYPFFFSN
ncbi:MAG: AgmX/PglI C-terminal domain-containing protein [Bdellovibrionaceae bacterium]|nr:AgmX/PglI C-terminal domain-containing protein [Pseudobdellovibrionaceae bacterium]